MTAKNRVGRPLKFKSNKELQEKIDAYFASCFEPDGVWKTDKKTGDETFIAYKDGWGNPKYKQVKPFTVTGLAIALDTTRDVLLDYEEKEEYSNTIKKAKQLIQEYAEEYLFNGKNQTSAIFNLKNNWGWKDKTETDLNNPDGNLKSLTVIKAVTKNDQRNDQSTS